MSVARCSQPPGRSSTTSRSTTSGRTSRRWRWRAFGQGSGNQTRTPASDPGASRSRNPIASPCTTRTFVSPCSSIARQRRRRCPACARRTPITSSSGRRCAIATIVSPSADPDVEHDGRRASEHRRQVEHRPFLDRAPSARRAVPPSRRAPAPNWRRRGLNVRTVPAWLGPAWSSGWVLRNLSMRWRPASTGRSAAPPVGEARGDALDAGVPVRVVEERDASTARSSRRRRRAARPPGARSLRQRSFVQRASGRRR